MKSVEECLCTALKETLTRFSHAKRNNGLERAEPAFITTDLPRTYLIKDRTSEYALSHGIWLCNAYRSPRESQDDARRARGGWVELRFMSGEAVGLSKSALKGRAFGARVP